MNVINNYFTLLLYLHAGDPSLNPLIMLYYTFFVYNYILHFVQAHPMLQRELINNIPLRIFQMINLLCNI